MIFREDESRIQNRNGQANFALLRKVALSLLKRQPDKLSIRATAARRLLRHRLS